MSMEFYGGYSKQYCDIYEPTKSHDFDVVEIARDMYRDYRYPIQCEGLGFYCIAKDTSDRIWLAFDRDDKQNYDNWQLLDYVLEKNKP